MRMVGCDGGSAGACGLRTGGGASRHHGESDLAGAGAGGAAGGLAVVPRTGGAACHQSPSAGLLSAAGGSGSTGKIGTISPTDPER
jgi:hypothetical protein